MLEFSYISARIYARIFLYVYARIIFKRLKARAQRFSKFLLKHNLSSKVIPKKTELGLYGTDSEFNLKSNSIPFLPPFVKIV